MPTNVILIYLCFSIVYHDLFERRLSLIINVGLVATAFLNPEIPTIDVVIGLSVGLGIGLFLIVILKRIRSVQAMGYGSVILMAGCGAWVGVAVAVLPWVLIGGGVGTMIYLGVRRIMDCDITSLIRIPIGAFLVLSLL